MNHANNGAKYGIDQYRFAHNYDFKDKTLAIASDAIKHSFRFAGKNKLEYDAGKGSESFDYECLKLDVDTYFVRFGTNVAVFEMTGGVGALVLADGFVFGAVDQAGQAQSGAIPCLTDEMTDTAVTWVLGCDKFFSRIYAEAGLCRAAWAPAKADFAEYPAKCVKIKEGMFLTDVTEPIPDGSCAPAGSDRIIALEDYERMMLVGCVFGKNPPLMISGYGEFIVP
ncbi:MAG: hypothetical protein FWH33_00800 [Oscillospiraceae bacterium]|nr:hypothetical protein [Oscillospiraceae bacterium]